MPARREVHPAHPGAAGGVTVNFLETSLAGVFVIEPERHCDERGFFARTFCAKEFARRGLEARIAQCSISFNPKRGTLRGMHLQIVPYEEVKLVRCIRGGVYDVALDLRHDSPTLGRWQAVELTANNGRLFYLPGGVAHGFLTLEDDTEVSYQISESYHPECARGVRWDDPAVGIRWPFAPVLLSARDASFSDLKAGWQLPEEGREHEGSR